MMSAYMEQDKRVLAVLHRLQEYGITLCREKCKLGQPEVIWFGNVFHKQGMIRAYKTFNNKS